MKPKPKITQDQISSAVPNLITHHIPNLKIDLNSSVVQRNKKPKRKSSSKPRTKSAPKVRKMEDENKDIAKEESSPTPPLPSSSFGMLSSDEESDEMDPEEKKENIRKILNWNPNDFLGEAKLSDEEQQLSSEDEINSTSKKRSKKTSSSEKKTTKKRRSIAPTSRVDLSEEEEIPEPNERRTSKRMSLRRSGAATKVSYKEEPKSDADISFSDSDQDKSYDLKQELKKNPSMLDLSEEDDSDSS